MDTLLVRNCISEGFISDTLNNQTLRGRMAFSQKIAAAITFLLSDAASCIIGTILPVTPSHAPDFTPTVRAPILRLSPCCAWVLTWNDRKSIGLLTPPPF